MDGEHKPLVSVGMPVFNGENYVEEAIQSILRQTFSRFELIISDNASSDRTPEICSRYAAMDNRVRYYRNAANIGADRNFHKVFELSLGKYFKWAAHDDLCATTFLERCIEVLEQDPSIVLCYPRSMIINEYGEVVGPYEVTADAAAEEPYARFYNMIGVDHCCYQMFGVARSSVLKEIRPLELYSGSDRVMLAELSLFGRLYELPEFLFFRRDHPFTSWRISSGRASRMKTYDPCDHPRQQHFLGVRRFWGYAGAVRHARLTVSGRMRCYGQLVRLGAEKSVIRIAKRARRALERVHTRRDSRLNSEQLQKNGIAE